LVADRLERPVGPVLVAEALVLEILVAALHLVVGDGDLRGEGGILGDCILDLHPAWEDLVTDGVHDLRVTHPDACLERLVVFGQEEGGVVAGEPAGGPEHALEASGHVEYVAISNLDPFVGGDDVLWIRPAACAAAGAAERNEEDDHQERAQAHEDGLGGALRDSEWRELRAAAPLAGHLWSPAE